MKKTTKIAIIGLVLALLAAVYVILSQQSKQQQLAQQIAAQNEELETERLKNQGISGILSGAGTVAGNLIKALIMF